MEKKIIFTGVGTALITPFSDGEIDYGEFGRLIDGQTAAGVDAIVIGGTTGEAATLSDRERYSLFEFARERVGKRARLVLGTGTNDTRVAKMHTKRAEQVGCDGVLLVTPYYNKGTDEGIVRHYLSIAESTSLPIMLYNVPSRTGVNLGLGILERLARQENIVAIKEASDSAERLTDLCGFGDALRLYAGNDSAFFSVLALGGAGVVSVASNVVPRAMGKIYAAYEAGLIEESRRTQLALMPLIKALFAETNPAPIKALMAARGLIGSEELRLPLSAARDTTRRALADAMVGLEISGLDR